MHTQPLAGTAGHARRPQGRLPSYIEPGLVIVVTDGRPVVYQDGRPVPVRCAPATRACRTRPNGPARGARIGARPMVQASLPPSLLPASELTSEPYRWDQRYFQWVLSALPRKPADASSLAWLADATGGPFSA